MNINYPFLSRNSKALTSVFLKNNTVSLVQCINGNNQAIIIFKVKNCRPWTQLSVDKKI